VGVDRIKKLYSLSEQIPHLPCFILFCFFFPVAFILLLLPLPLLFLHTSPLIPFRFLLPFLPPLPSTPLLYLLYLY